MCVPPLTTPVVAAVAAILVVCLVVGIVVAVEAAVFVCVVVGIVVALVAAVVVRLVVGSVTIMYHSSLFGSCVGALVTGSSHFSESENGEHCIEEFYKMGKKEQLSIDK